VLGLTYDTENCSAARALELVGDRWSLLIIRDALFREATRFSDFERNLGVARNILTARLDRFVSDGLMLRRPRTDGARQHDYILTEKGRDFGQVIIALSTWGDRWAAPAGPPVIFEHRGCGGAATAHLDCQHCRAPLTADDVVTQPGPGTRSASPDGRNGSSRS
jgi:DNA-binding HxlR family transcriptional regulator